MQAILSILLKTTTIKASITVLLLTVVNVFCVYGQNDNAIYSRILQQLQRFPQEKTYIHTDATTYLPSERVWLKVYVVEALSHEPTNNSRYAYVELIAPNGSLVERIKLQEQNGAYAGYIDLPASLRAGCYLLRSYTLLSASINHYESVQPLYITDGQQATTPKMLNPQCQLPPIPTPIASTITFEREANKIIVSTTQQGNNLFLLAHCRAYPFLCKPISTTQSIIIDKDSIPQGVIQLLLLDQHANVLSTRMLLSANDQERLSLPLMPNKKAYRTGSHIRVPFDESLLHIGERADLSVSVRAEEITHDDQRSTILSHLFLATDVNTLLPNASTFYHHPHLADSLLAAYTWTRYNIGEVLKGVYQAASIPAEQGQTLSGKVRTFLRRRPVEKARVSLIIPSIGEATVTTTDSLGQFLFEGTDLPAETEYLLKANKENGSEQIELTIHETDYPLLPSKEQLAAAGASYKTTGMPHYEQVDEHSFGGILLDNVNVITQKSYAASKSDAYARLSEYSFGSKEIDELNATCMHELLRRVPGIFVRQEKCYVRAVTTVYGDQRPAAIVIDGVFTDEGYDLDQINMADVARIDVYKSGTTVIWGSRGGSGVISITTKRGVDSNQPTVKPNQKKVIPLGYQRPCTFSRLSEASRTVWWAPVITTPYIEFDASSLTGNYHITVEGVTSEGRLVHEECNISCNSTD